MSYVNLPRKTVTVEEIVEAANASGFIHDLKAAVSADYFSHYAKRLRALGWEPEHPLRVEAWLLHELERVTAEQRQQKKQAAGGTWGVDSLGGFCPVQGFGWVKGSDGPQSWYFRARGGEWRLSVGSEDETIGCYVDVGAEVWGAIGADPTDGFMEREDARKLIGEVLDAYLAGRTGDGWKGGRSGH